MRYNTQFMKLSQGTQPIFLRYASVDFNQKDVHLRWWQLFKKMGKTLWRSTRQTRKKQLILVPKIGIMDIFNSNVKRKTSPHPIILSAVK